MSEWTNPLPKARFAQYVDKSTWDHGKLSVEIASLIKLPREEPNSWHIHVMTCSPAFALFIADESLATSLWSRRNELGLKAHHLIVEDSDWISSFVDNEFYVGNPEIGDKRYKNLVHYVLGADNDFIHIVASEPPQFTDNGLFSIDDLPTDNTPPLTTLGISSAAMRNLKKPSTRYKKVRH